MAYQASKRGGVLNLRTDDQRVYISGKAITFSRQKKRTADSISSGSPCFLL
ncbi:hypothetical protein [Caldicellulosiruptor acetigenus]|uniref:hypothetical protein n=1 Tax=Caldicellulosiruptor acetigenus TaxID=301953 RepID=UPI00030A134B|nr:hypothetical protein [Caldicellulosiruptor acetigenus]